MEEIKVGEYVRLARNQGINKIIEINEYGFLILDCSIMDEWGDETERIFKNDIDEEIIEHSFEPIELIKEGDYVNGCKVKDVTENKVELEIVANVSGEFYSETISKNDIKSIVTKEQFENITYKL